MLLSSFITILFKKVRVLAEKNHAIAIIVQFILVVFLNGVFLLPAKFFQRIAENPFVTRTDIGEVNYWQETILLPIIAFYTGLNSPFAFIVLCIVIIIAGYLLFGTLVLKKWGPVSALIFPAILISSPLTTVLLSWLGTADGLSFLLTIPFLFLNSFPLLLLCALLGTTNHLLVPIAGVGIVLLRWIGHDGIKIRHMLGVMVGGIAGYGIVTLFFLLNHIEVVSRLEYIYLKTIEEWVNINVSHFPMTIFSLFNIQWLIIVLCLIMFFRLDKRFYSAMIGVLLVNYTVTFFTEDTTRIFSLLSWGVLMQCIFHSYKLAKTQGQIYEEEFLKALFMFGIVSFLSPRYYSWQGLIVPSPFSNLFR